MRVITTQDGKECLVDDDKYEWLNQFKWRGNPSGRKFRAQTSIYLGKKDGSDIRLTVGMHQLVLGKLPKGKVVDHIDGNSLNNQLYNLRAATHTENMRNRAPDLGSVYKGIKRYDLPRGPRWAARIKMGSKNIHLGMYDSAEDAARAYDWAAKTHFREFARLNFPYHTGIDLLG